MQDAALLTVFRPPSYVPWGLLAAIDLHGCERSCSPIPTTSVASCRP